MKEKRFGIDDVKYIIVRYCDQLWTFHPIPNMGQGTMTILENGLQAVYESPRAYRPIYIGYPLSQVSASKAKVQIEFDKISYQTSHFIAFFEDPELLQPNWLHNKWDTVQEVILKNTPIISAAGQHIHWRGKVKWISFVGKKEDVTVSVDLQSHTAEIISSNEMTVLDGITEHTRVLIITDHTRMTLKSCEFEY